MVGGRGVVWSFKKRDETHYSDFEKIRDRNFRNENATVLANR